MTIWIEVNYDEVTKGGILRLSEKISENTYNALAIAILNKECYEKLNELQGEYTLSETSHNNDFKKPCSECKGTGVIKWGTNDIGIECSHCKGQGFIKS